MSLRRDPLPPIAIIGIGVRLPGKISTTEDFWDLLVNKRDGRCRVPPDRYNVDAFHQAHRQAVAAEYGCFLDHINIQAFDLSSFPINIHEAVHVDPQQRLLMEVISECFENAGQARVKGTDTGVYIGAFGEDWHNLSHLDSQSTPNPLRITCASDYALSNQMSKLFDLRGPSITVRTACSSSISCLHLACQALYYGDCSMAIVAASSLILDPAMTIDMAAYGVLSPSGSCKTFDAAADGFVRAEGINAILIKPLEDALRDNDPIRAVIRSTSVNSDAGLSPIGVPSQEAQEMLIRKAYSFAGIDDFSQTPFVEFHGTGTAMGDPIEAKAVANVFGKRGTYIGSVKSNIGHSEGAAGLSSVIKAVLALEHQVIPPNIHFSEPNPKIPFDEFDLRVPTEPVPWPADRALRVSVNSFGFGGANAHVILESASSFGAHLTASFPKPPETRSPKHLVNGGSDKSHRSSQIETAAHNGHVLVNGDIKEAIRPWPFLLPLSANNAVSLKMREESLREYIQTRDPHFGSIAYTLGARRHHSPQRSFCIVEGSKDECLDFKTAPKTTNANSNIVFVFTGQGAQWVGMGKELVTSSRSFLEDIREMDRILSGLGEPPDWTIEGTLCASYAQERIGKAEFAQPLCTAIQMALVNFLARCGIKPSAVVGHSSGEIAAAYTAGALTMAEALLCGYFRGLAMSRGQTRVGTMAAVGMSRQAVIPYLAEGVVVACENSPKSVTISGDADAVKKTLEAIVSDDAGVFVRQLHVDVAYHSHHMDEVADCYEEMLSHHLSGNKTAQVPFYSTVTGQVVEAETGFGPEYWSSNLRSPVLFYDAVGALLSEMKGGAGLFLEIGPHSVLRGPLEQIIQVISLSGRFKNLAYVPTLIRDKDSLKSTLDSLGQLFVRGHDISFSFINQKTPTLVDLPRYPWDHSLEVWKESRASESWRLRKHAYHELLGARCLEVIDTEPMWRNTLTLVDVQWLSDHKIQDNVVFPFAGYITMIGEAIRQITGSDGYSLRNVVLKSGMIIQESDVIEIVTTMRPLRLTDYTNSSWYELSISSNNGISWTQHCIAEAKSLEKATASAIMTAIANPRRVSEDVCYKQLRRVGMNIGPRLQLMRDICLDRGALRATAALRNSGGEQGLMLDSRHPFAIDMCLQLGAISSFRGKSFRPEMFRAPSTIKRMHVHPGGTELSAQAAAHFDEYGGMHVSAAAFTKDGRAVIEIEDIMYHPLDLASALSEGVDSLKSARMEWRPHVDFCKPMNLLCRRRVSGELDSRLIAHRSACLLILWMLDTLGPSIMAMSLSEHLAKYVSWLRHEKERMEKGEWDELVPEAKQWTTCGAEALDDSLKKLLDEMGEAGEFSRLARKLIQGDNMRAIFAGEMSPQDLLDDTSRDLYSCGNEALNADDALYLTAHSKPTLKVLEVGAGTGATTEQVLGCLVSEGGVRMFSEYTFTDDTSRWFAKAQEQLKSWDGLHFKVFDMSRDPVEQGFERESYDLVVASNALHTVPSLSQALGNIRSLLRPGGRLLIREAISGTPWRYIHVAMGLFPQWWLGGADEPLVSMEAWDSELRKAGFSGADAALLDDEPFHLNASIVSRAVEAISRRQAVTLLYHEAKHEVARDLARLLEEGGTSVHWSRIGDADPVEEQDVISTVDLEGPYFYNFTEKTYADFFTYLSKMKGGSVLWLTRAAQIHCTDPRYGLVTGLARNIRLEMDLDIWTAELPVLDHANVAATLAICHRFLERPATIAGNAADCEFAVHDGAVYVGRYHWVSMSTELESQQDEGDDEGDGVKRLTVGQFGVINSLHWVECEQDVLGDDEVEIDVKYSGLNFRDLMITLGFVPGAKDRLGIESAGVITRVGPKVQHLAVGDRVQSLGQKSLRTLQVLPAKNASVIPREISLEDAATMPVAYGTVFHAFITLCQLAEGQSVLIHSACGGVGLAAIMMCKILGAEIYATVGSEEKVQHLMQQHCLPRERIFSSRDASFYDGVMQATGGRGVDVVLNSLSGDLLHASWQCVARSGKLVEIGKRDQFENGSLALNMFRHNRSFYGVDLELLGNADVGEMMGNLRALGKRHSMDSAPPIRPVHTYPAHQVIDAMNLLKTGKHIGKVLIKMPDDARELPVVSKRSRPRFSPTSTYLLVGGLGGIGKAITLWMVEEGARSFVFLSRSAGESTADQLFLAELETDGCCAVAVAGSVAERADVDRAVGAAPSKIAGVMQMSMVVRDLKLDETKLEDWSAAVDPKVKGTWNLHEALIDAELDFFILFGSIIGLWGQPTQANYAAANTFLDSFVQFRHGLGLACSVIDLGAVEEVGLVSHKSDMLRYYRDMSMLFVQEEDLKEALQVSIQRSFGAGSKRGPTQEPSEPRQTQSGNLVLVNMGQVAVGLGSTTPLSNPKNFSPLRNDVRTAVYWQMQGGTAGGASAEDEGIRQLLSSVNAEPRILNHVDTLRDMTAEIGRHLVKALDMPDEDLDPQTSLESLGVDSLRAVGVREWWRKTLGMNVSIIDLKNAGTVEGLGKLALRQLRKKYGVDGDEGEEESHKER